jgi:multiple sugar transport system permease protein
MASRRLVFVALCLLAGLYLFPFYWLVQSSFKDAAALKAVPPAFLPTAETRTEARLSVPVADGWARLAAGTDPDSGRRDGAWWLRLGSEAVEWRPDGAAPAAAAITLPNRRVVDWNGTPHIELASILRSTDGQVRRTSILQPPDGQAPVAVADAHLTAQRHLAPRWANYGETLAGPEAAIGGEGHGFARFLINSLIISLAAVAAQILSSSLAAFAFARLSFPGRDLLFVLMLATLMVPAQVTMIPLFGIWKSLGALDSFIPLILPHCTAGAFNVFLLRQYMLTLPKELDESAAIDGAGALRTWWSVILPNCTPALIVVGLFTFVGTWQDVLGPLIYLDDPALRTVPLGLEYFRSPYVDNSHLLLAGAVLSMLPVAILFLFLQRRILGGLVTAGIKG